MADTRETTPAPRRIIPGWLSWWWGVPGNGIDFQPGTTLYGIGVRMTFIGAVRVAKRRAA